MIINKYDIYYMYQCMSLQSLWINGPRHVGGWDRYCNYYFWCHPFDWNGGVKTIDFCSYISLASLIFLVALND